VTNPTQREQPLDEIMASLAPQHRARQRYERLCRDAVVLPARLATQRDALQRQVQERDHTITVLRASLRERASFDRRATLRVLVFVAPLLIGGGMAIGARL
jgi:hypothetical protein